MHLFLLCFKTCSSGKVSIICRSGDVEVDQQHAAQRSPSQVGPKTPDILTLI